MERKLAEITRIVRSLSPEDRAHVGIFCCNYGEAASLEWLGHDLPPVISEHNTYWLWGTRGLDTEVMIIDRGGTPEKLHEYYTDVQMVGRVDNPLHAVRAAQHLSGATSQGADRSGLGPKQLLLLM